VKWDDEGELGGMEQLKRKEEIGGDTSMKRRFQAVVGDTRRESEVQKMQGAEREGRGEKGDQKGQGMEMMDQKNKEI